MANQNVANADIVIPELKNGNLVIEREVIKKNDGRELKSKDGRTCYAYMIKGTVRGRQTKVDFEPKDKGGYEPLDIVFDVSPKAELIIEERDNIQADGSKQHYTAYKARTIDDLGIVYECGIKLKRNSDKDILNMLLNVVAARGEQA